jgi:hypothetical protein
MVVVEAAEFCRLVDAGLGEKQANLSQEQSCLWKIYLNDVMSDLGQKATCAPQKVMSALPSKRTCAVQEPMSAMGQKRTYSLIALN